jgi:hypothetical protein
MSTLRVNAIVDASGGNTATINTYMPPAPVRAWVNFNGTGTVAIRGSYNVSSITDGGTGIYTVNFTTALTDANYSASGLAGFPGVTNGYVIINTPTASTFPMATLNTSQAVFDPTYVLMSFFR